MLNGDSVSHSEVSDTIRAFHDRGRPTSEWTAKNLYPLYITGQIRTVPELVDALVGLEMEAKLEEVSTLAEQSQDLMAQAAQSDAKRPDYDGSEIETSPIGFLSDVQKSKRINKRGETVKCTRLIFENAPERIMDEVFDKDGSITEEAIRLKTLGKPIVTTVWQPHIFDCMKWWRSIYDATDLQAKP